MNLTTDHVDGRMICEGRHTNISQNIISSFDLDIKYSPKFITVPDGKKTSYVRNK